MCRTYLPNRTEKRLAIPERAFVSDSQLCEWVDAELLEHLKAERIFTAYRITLSLRAQHPDCQIVHTSVQRRVHAIMERVSHYDMTWELWSGEPARTYAPVGDATANDVFISAPQVIVGHPELARLAQAVCINWDEKDD